MDSRRRGPRGSAPESGRQAPPAPDDPLEEWVERVWEEATRQETLVLAESHDELRDALAARLGQHGYRVVPAKTGGEALRLVRRESPDLVLVDLWLEDQPGADLVARLRASWSTRGVPIVALSTDPVPAHALRVLGVQELCLMPMPPDALVAAVARALDAARREAPGDAADDTDAQYGLALEVGMRSENLTLGTWFRARIRFGLTPLNEPILQRMRQQLFQRGIASEVRVEDGDVVLSCTLTVADALAIGFNSVAPDELFFALVDEYPELVRETDAVRRRISTLEREFQRLIRLAG